MKKNIISLLLTFAAATLFPEISGAISPSYYTTSSVLGSGKWIKVKVTKTGMQEISFDELRAAGFSDPSKVVVFGYGGIGDRLLSLSTENKWLDDLTQVYSMTYDNRKLVFYGESGLKYEWSGTTMVIPFENFDSTDGYYFLTDSKERLATAPLSFNPEQRTVLHTEAPRLTVARHALEANPAEAGARLFSNNLMESEDDTAPKTITFTLDNYREDTKIYANISIIAAGSNNPVITVSTGTKSKKLQTSAYMKAFAGSTYNINEEIPTRTGLQDGAAELDMTFSHQPSDNVTMMGYESLTVGYFGHSLLGIRSNKIFQYVSVNTSSRIPLEEESETACVWAISKYQAVTPLEIYKDPVSGERFFGATGSFTSGSNQYKVALFDPERELNKAEITGEVANQNIHFRNTPHMIIIAAPDLIGQAQRLAQAHNSFNGMDVLVVTPQQVYNEFSSGTPSVNAYRRMAKMFYDRDPGHSRFRHLMLMGTGVYDSRLRTPSFQSLDPEDMVLTFATRDLSYIPSASYSFTSDSFIGFLEDNKTYTSFHSASSNSTGAISIAVGRLPVMTESDAKAYVDKVVAYLSGDYNYGSFNRAVLISDDGDQDSHLSQAQEVASLIAAASPATTVTRIYNSIYPWENKIATNATKALTSALREGVSYLCFLGHGRPDAITAEFIISKESASSTTYKNQPFMFFATCDVFAFDKRNDNFCERLLKKAEGGALALVGSGRTVYQDRNQKLNLAFAEELFNPSSTAGRTYGEAFIAAVNRSYIAKDQDYLINTLCYNYGGDPALPILYPTSDTDIQSINGEAIDNFDQDAAPVMLVPGKQNRLVANIHTGGELDPNFSGWADITIYESPDVVKNLYQDNAPASERREPEISRDETILISRRARVNAGIIDEQLLIPESRRPGEKNRLTIAAISDDGTLRSVAYTTNISVADNGETPADTDAPVIDALYIGTPAFADGDIIGSSSILCAEILPDESGIILFNSEIGTGPRLTLDNSRSFSDLANSVTINEDGSATLRYPLENLEDGPHTLRLLINDYAGNIAARDINFTVVNSSATAELAIDQSIVRDEAVFTLSHTFPAEEPTGHIIIERTDGTPVFTRSGISFPFSWDLTSDSGEKVPDGFYRARTYLSTSTHYNSTPEISFHVLKNTAAE